LGKKLFRKYRLLVLSAIVGVTDIDPFILSLINGASHIEPVIVSAIIIAMMSNTNH